MTNESPKAIKSYRVEYDQDLTDSEYAIAKHGDTLRENHRLSVVTASEIASQISISAEGFEQAIKGLAKGLQDHVLPAFEHLMTQHDPLSTMLTGRAWLDAWIAEHGPLTPSTPLPPDAKFIRESLAVGVCCSQYRCDDGTEIEVVDQEKWNRPGMYERISYTPTVAKPPSIAAGVVPVVFTAFSLFDLKPRQQPKPSTVIQPRPDRAKRAIDLSEE